jgi:hypothetical protein
MAPSHVSIVQRLLDHSEAGLKLCGPRPVKLASRSESGGKVLTFPELPEQPKQLMRRLIYTPMNDMYAFNRKIDFIPYFGDSSVDVSVSFTYPADRHQGDAETQKQDRQTLGHSLPQNRA